MPRTTRDLSGRRYGRWTVLSMMPRAFAAKIYYWCKCDCGTERTVRADGLTSYTSCGCFKAERAKEIFTKHNMCRSAEYLAWQGTKARCYQSTADGFANYGGRGIRVCDRWRDSFENFYADMGPRPSKRHSLDRVNNDGNYEPSNCRWATKAVQSRNTRRNVYLTAFGRTQTVTDWSSEMGVDHGTLRQRLRWNWTPEEALSTAPHAIRHNFKALRKSA